MTAKEIARDGKERVDALVMEMIEEYGLDMVRCATVENAMKNEVSKAIFEMLEYGKILSNKERWC